MDLVSSCKDKLAYFRIKELKDVLTQLSLPKQGKKQDLVDRILDVLSDDQGSKLLAWSKRNSTKEGAAKIIDDIYRKMQVPGATDLASKGQNVSAINTVKPKEEIDDSSQFDMKIRCPCGSSLLTDSMVKCDDPKCNVWQHESCVIIPEKPMEGVQLDRPSQFHCEICRINRADPFWVTLGQPLPPVKLTTSNIPTDGTNPVLSVEKQFALKRADRDLLQKPGYGLQIAQFRGKIGRFGDLTAQTAVGIMNPGLFLNPRFQYEEGFVYSDTIRSGVTKIIERLAPDVTFAIEATREAWCILLNDKVPFRMQWPQYADLQVNGESVRTSNRPPTQLLGINGRDDGPAIAPLSREGINRISLAACDARVFCFGVRIVRRRTVQQILSMVPKESEGERFEDALVRVCRCIGGGTTNGNADDSDSDLEVVADSVTVNLRCPMSGSRIKTAGRFKPCVHMGCFDLGAFVELNQRSRKWQCPICLENYSLENIIIDPYFNRIASLMRACGEDMTEIDVKPDGSWRVKNENEYKNLGKWHLPNGSLCTINGEAKPNLEFLKQIKQEGGSESPTATGFKSGMKRNQDVVWELSKPEDMQPLSSGNYISEKFENHNPKFMRMSPSATESNRDGDDPSVNQEGGHFDFSTNNGHELDSISLNFDPSTFGIAHGIVTSAPVGASDVIVLSDTEEDNREGFNFRAPTVSLISPEKVYEPGLSDGNRIPFPIDPPGVIDQLPDDSGLGTDGLGLYNNNGDDLVMPFWTGQSTGFQLFGTDTDAPDALVDGPHNSVVYPTPINGYDGLGADQGIGPADSRVQDSLICTSNASGIDENSLPFGASDPSLQLFLPSQPAGQSVRADFRDHADASNGIHDTEHWITLSLGGVGSHDQPAEPMPTLHSRHQLTSKEGSMETLANAGFFLNPRFQYEEGFVYSDNIRSGVTKVIERLAPNVTFAIEATREIAQFRGKIGRFGDLTAQTAVGIMNPASLLSSGIGNDGRTNKTNPGRQTLGGPFSHPRQPRSVRPRYLSIDLDSE